MAERTQIQKPEPQKRETQETSVEPEITDSTEQLEQIDNWLDEIDAVLGETDAQAFVDSFVQKGGQ